MGTSSSTPSVTASDSDSWVFFQAPPTVEIVNKVYSESRLRTRPLEVECWAVNSGSVMEVPDHSRAAVIGKNKEWAFILTKYGQGWIRCAQLEMKTWSPYKSASLPVRKLTLFHYTDHGGWSGIWNTETKVLKASTSGAFGGGVYLTSINHHTDAKHIKQNNWCNEDGGSSTMWVIEVHFDLTVANGAYESLKCVGIDHLGRDVWLFEGDLEDSRGGVSFSDWH
eukprot:TRINITY_DN103319_c0_g1_i1.p1 TRINITY_DN103319_c0_g1~~TRINITY_DN103319_c0_g1_i1.p1  ORF type:complete len:224 (-),score=25.57 TRINITY_DN103319_c0_g1_i1:108-779(-)